MIDIHGKVLIIGCRVVYPHHDGHKLMKGTITALDRPYVFLVNGLRLHWSSVSVYRYPKPIDNKLS